MLFQNNEIGIILTQNTKSQYCTKHINVQYHYIQKLVNKKELIIKQIPSSKILAVEITRILFAKTFQKH